MEDPMVKLALGYYRRDTGDGYTCNYFMNSEPPDGQFVLRGDVWLPLPDGFYLADRLLDGDPEFDGPFPDPPAGVLPARVLISR
jgi:hypothetical protein